MSDQRDKDFVRHSVDTGLSSLEGNPFLAQRIMNRERTEKPMMKRKMSIALILAMALLVACAATAIAGATNEAFNAWLYDLWPEAALKLMPVDLSFENKGFRLEVNSAAVTGDEVLISYTVEDLEGDRLMHSSRYPQVFLRDNVVDSWRGAESYDEETHKLYSAEYVKYTGPITEPGNGTLNFVWQLFEHYEYHDTDLLAYLKEYGAQLGTTSALPEGLKVGRPAITPDLTTFAESGLPDTLQIIDSSDSLEIRLFENVCLAGVKVIDGQLHIQVHVHDPHWEINGDTMYNPYEIMADMQDEDANDLPYVFENSHEEMRVLTWGRKGSAGGVPEWTEFIYPVDAEKLESAESLPFLLRKCLGVINARCGVSIPLRMIRK